MPDAPSRIDQFRRMTEDAPNDPLGHFSLGGALLEAGSPAEAAAALQRVLALDPNLSKAYELLGRAQSLTGHKELAVQTLADGVRVAHRRGDVKPKEEMSRMLAELGAPVPQFAAAGVTVEAGSGQVLCKRCGDVKPQLPKPPFRTPFGQQIFDHTCAPCWQEAIRMGTKVINELRLPLADPQAQKVWDQHIKEFLNL